MAVRAERAEIVHYAWVVAAMTFLALLIASGIRASFGVYVKPFEAEFHVTRTDVALVASLSVLVNGIIQPVVGHLIDQRGVRFVAVGSLLIAALGILASAFATGLWQLYITFSIVVSAAVGGPATAMATVVAARWFAKQRGLVMGLMSAGHSAGQLVLIPLAMQLNLLFGWRLSYVLLGLGIAVLTLPIGLLIRSDPRDIGKRPYGAEGAATSSQMGQSGEQGMRTPLGRALRTHGFWMLALGFFVCGYTTAGMISTHLVAFTVERGFDSMTAAAALGLMGAVNVLGTIVSGVITDRVGRKGPLAAIYLVRGVALLFLLVVHDALTLNIFAVIFGMSYIATVPPTSALTAHLFGRLSVGTIFGVIFMSHQIGAAFGSYISGRIFDLLGSYDIALLLGAILCFVAAAMSFSIKELPARRAAPAVAPR